MFGKFLVGSSNAVDILICYSSLRYNQVRDCYSLELFFPHRVVLDRLNESDKVTTNVTSATSRLRRKLSANSVGTTALCNCMNCNRLNRDWLLLISDWLQACKVIRLDGRRRRKEQNRWKTKYTAPCRIKCRHCGWRRWYLGEGSLGG